MFALSPLRRIFPAGKLEGMTINDGFEAHWRNIVAKDPKLAQFPKSYRDQLLVAYMAGYVHGSASRETERKEHGKD
jgi:hypothetical protein